LLKKLKERGDPPKNERSTMRFEPSLLEETQDTVGTLLQTLSRLEPHRGSLEGDERRSEDRYHFVFEGVALALDPQREGELSPCSTINISRSGVGLLLNEPLEPGQFFLLLLRHQDEEALRALIRIVWCERFPEQEEQAWLAGAQFLQPE
jgi:hypothetical protein